MSVGKMKRLSLLVMEQDADRMIKRLMRLSCVEVSADDGAAPLPKADAERFSLVQSELTRIGQAMAVLNRYDTVKKSLFGRRARMDYERLSEDRETVEQALALAEEAIALEKGLKSGEEQIAVQEAAVRALAPWLPLDLPLSEEGSETASLRFGYFPYERDLESMLSEREHCPHLVLDTVSLREKEAGKRERNRFVTVLYRRDEEEAALETLSAIGWQSVDLSGFSGSAKQESDAASEEIKRLRDEAKEKTERLRELSAALPILRLASDMLQTEHARLEAMASLSRTETTVHLHGWVPESACGRVEKALSDLLCAWELTEPEEGEEPPVLLEGSPHLDPFRMVIGLYALPKYGSFDPTLVMSIFYFIIFGAMLADFVYGLLISVVCFAALRFLDLHGGTRQMVKLFGICGISCMLMGILMGSYLGDLPTVIMKNMLGIENPPATALLFDPVQDPISFLIFSLVIGAVHLLFGMGIKAYTLIRMGRGWAALFDVGSWYLVFAGIGLFFLNSAIGAVVLLIGATMLLLSQGREKKGIFGKATGGLLSLYKIVSYGSDLLSYSRIMALGMSSAVIASVINVIATLNGPTVLGWIILILVVPFGTVINLAINLLGSFVHTCRLQYIEFFDKFYEAGGRAFSPLTPKSTYTEITAEEEGTPASNLKTTSCIDRKTEE